MVWPSKEQSQMECPSSLPHVDNLEKEEYTELLRVLKSLPCFLSSLYEWTTITGRISCASLLTLGISQTEVCNYLGDSLVYSTCARVSSLFD